MLGHMHMQVHENEQMGWEEEILCLYWINIRINNINISALGEGVMQSHTCFSETQTYAHTSIP